MDAYRYDLLFDNSIRFVMLKIGWRVFGKFPTELQMPFRVILCAMVLCAMIYNTYFRGRMIW